MPKWREQQLPKILISLLALAVQQFDPHIPQGKPLHLLAVLPRRFQRYKAALWLHDGVTQFLRHSIAVPGGTGGRIACAPGSKDHPLAGDRPSLRCLHPGDALSVGEDPLDRLGLHGNTHLPHPALKSIQHRLRTIRDWEYPVSPFGFQRASGVLKETARLLRWEGCHHAVQKFSVAGSVLKHLLGVAVVGNIAPALACDQQFFPQPGILFQQQD